MKRAFVIPATLVVALVFGVTIHLVTAQPHTYTAQLSGADEVPPVETKARGNAIFKLNTDGTEISYRVIVANIENVRASHIHLAPAGVNGPVVVTLFGGPTREGHVSGVLAEGTITAAYLQGPLAGESLDVLLGRLNDGELYVNVHTDQFPSGEIRGQVK